ncbi:GntR family transcriptional regulator [Peptostreptococcus faecalis]|uniref:GntR family transcriptional regulator n=1 Tax=Peptostreptococcus faecalis TaxID=2045015 RepID=UPI000C7A001D|nr:GntR family transcriptional regulator [Peptostreptococcus faecalis]
MVLEIDFTSNVAIYQQIIDGIIKGVFVGDIKPLEPLPSVRQLGQDIGVNLHTVNKAYQQLKERGYIQIDKRSGAYISEEFGNLSKNEKSEFQSKLETLIIDALLKNTDRENILKIVDDIIKKGREL